MAPKIHEALLGDDFVLKAYEDNDLRKAFERMQTHCDEMPLHPRIYGNTLAHETTRLNITAHELWDLVQVIKKYPFDDVVGSAIDNAHNKGLDEPLTRLGCRKYLSDSYKSKTRTCGLPVPIRVAKLGVPCRAFERRCTAVPPALWHQPLTGSITEWGYTNNVNLRLSQHRNHQLSNYFMNIVEATCTAFQPGYKFHQFVVYHIPSEDLVELAKIYITRAGQGYSSNGGGLAHPGAGRSNASKRNYN